MTNKEIEKFMAHCERFFGQSEQIIMHPVVMEPHVDILVYPPNQKFDFWKLVTMGASDYKMPPQKSSLGDRNEYMMFVRTDKDLSQKENAAPYCKYLWDVALYPAQNHQAVSYGHSIEFPPEEGSEMVTAFLEMPQILADIGVLRCKTGLFKTIICLQIVLLNRAETDKLLEIGPQAFSDYLYPEEGRPHFLSELDRSELF